MLFDFGAEVSIVDTTFARKVGCVTDIVKGKSELELDRTFMWQMVDQFLIQLTYTETIQYDIFSE